MHSPRRSGTREYTVRSGPRPADRPHRQVLRCGHSIPSTPHRPPSASRRLHCRPRGQSHLASQRRRRSRSHLRGRSRPSPPTTMGGCCLRKMRGPPPRGRQRQRASREDCTRSPPHDRRRTETSHSLTGVLAFDERVKGTTGRVDGSRTRDPRGMRHSLAPRGASLRGGARTLPFEEPGPSRFRRKGPALRRRPWVLSRRSKRFRRRNRVLGTRMRLLGRRTMTLPTEDRVLSS
jgi:hypothetical protein